MSRRSEKLPAGLLVCAALVALGLAAREPGIEGPSPPAGGKDRGRSSDSAATAKESPSASEQCIQRTSRRPTRAARPGPDPRCPPDPEGPWKLRRGKVAFREAAGGEELIDVEIAETEDARKRGLMYRRQLADSQGMLFVFDESRDHSLWMRNTCIPLDMIFIDDDGTIVGIEENTVPMSDVIYSVGCSSAYVLEVNAGWTRKNGVEAGQKVELQRI